MGRVKKGERKGGKWKGKERMMRKNEGWKGEADRKVKKWEDRK